MPIKRGDRLLLKGHWRLDRPVTAENDKRYGTVPIRHPDFRTIVNVRNVRPIDGTPSAL